MSDYPGGIAIVYGGFSRLVSQYSDNNNTDKPVLSRHPRDLRYCLLNTGCLLDRGSDTYCSIIVNY